MNADTAVLRQEGASDDLRARMVTIGEAARNAAAELALTPAEIKAKALRAAAESIRRASAEILAANAKDMEAARAKGLSTAMLDRLALNTARIDAMAGGMEAIRSVEVRRGPAWPGVASKRPKTHSRTG